VTTFTLQTPPGFKYMPTIWSHGWYQLAPFQFDEPARALSRVHELADGSVVRISVAPQDDDRALAVTVEGLLGALTGAQQAEITQAVTRILALDIDLNDFYAALRDRPDYAWIERAGAGRIMVSPTVWEDLAKTLLTTNPTWNMTRQVVGRLRAGQPSANPTPRLPQTADRRRPERTTQRQSAPGIAALTTGWRRARRWAGRKPVRRRRRRRRTLQARPLVQGLRRLRGRRMLQLISATTG
jgi:hypothetical protein